MSRRILTFVAGVCMLLETGCATGNRIAVPKTMARVGTHRMKVFADQGWQTSDIEIQEGDFVKIVASGRWSSGIGTSGPEGTVAANVFDWL